MTSSAAVGVELPVMQRHASLCTLGSPVPHCCNVGEIIFLTIMVYIHHSPDELQPHIFPEMFLHTISDDFALLAVFST